MPSYTEEIFRQFLEAYYHDVEGELAGALNGVAPHTATTIGAGVAAYIGAYRSSPTLIVAGGDAYGELMDATGVLRFRSRYKLIS